MFKVTLSPEEVVVVSVLVVEDESPLELVSVLVEVLLPPQPARQPSIMTLAANRANNFFAFISGSPFEFCFLNTPQRAEFTDFTVVQSLL
jgi:hypothetical protein